MPSMQAAKLTVRRQRAPFGGTCLPLTMELARLVKPTLLPAMAATPRNWCYEDRVLVLLAPWMRADIEQFYNGTTTAMTDTFEQHQVDRLDRSFVEQLFTFVESLSPALAAGIRAASEPSDVRPSSSVAKG